MVLLIKTGYKFRIIVLIQFLNKCGLLKSYSDIDVFANFVNNVAKKCENNLSFYLWLVGEAREQILAGTYKSWKDKMVKQVMTRL
mgnify:CR=1 FL=1